MQTEIYKIRIVSNACITRYDRGEKDIVAIINSYNIPEEDKHLVYEHIYALRPDIVSSTPS